MAWCAGNCPFCKLLLFRELVHWFWFETYPGVLGSSSLHCILYRGQPGQLREVLRATDFSLRWLQTSEPPDPHSEQRLCRVGFHMMGTTCFPFVEYGETSRWFQTQSDLTRWNTQHKAYKFPTWRSTHEQTCFNAHALNNSRWQINSEYITPFFSPVVQHPQHWWLYLWHDFFCQHNLWLAVFSLHLGPSLDGKPRHLAFPQGNKLW